MDRRSQTPKDAGTECIEAPGMVTVGQVCGVFGVQGWVKVLSYTRPRENLFNYQPWQVELNGHQQMYELESGRAQGNGLVAKLRTVGDPDSARALMGASIAVPVSQLPPLPEGEFYWSQLLGLRVMHSATGRELGNVTALMETGANDVLVLGGTREQLVPFVWGAVIKRVDLEQGMIEADWDPDG